MSFELQLVHKKAETNSSHPSYNLYADPFLVYTKDLFCYAAIEGAGVGAAMDGGGGGGGRCRRGGGLRVGPRANWR